MKPQLFPLSFKDATGLESGEIRRIKTVVVDRWLARAVKDGLPRVRFYSEQFDVKAQALPQSQPLKERSMNIDALKVVLYILQCRIGGEWYYVSENGISIYYHQPTAKPPRLPRP